MDQLDETFHWRCQTMRATVRVNANASDVLEALTLNWPLSTILESPAAKMTDSLLLILQKHFLLVTRYLLLIFRTIRHSVLASNVPSKVVKALHSYLVRVRNHQLTSSKNWQCSISTCYREDRPVFWDYLPMGKDLWPAKSSDGIERCVMWRWCWIDRWESTLLAQWLRQLAHSRSFRVRIPVPARQICTGNNI